MVEVIPVALVEVGALTIRVDASESDEPMLQAVALQLADLAGFRLRFTEGAWQVEISPFKGGIEAADIARHFDNHMIDQKLRRKIAEQTSTERDLILSHAFSRTRFIQT